MSELIQWFDNHSIPAAITAAQESGKPLLVDFFHPTCKGCAKLFLTTYRDDRVREFLADQVVAIKYNTTEPNVWFRRLNGSFAHHWHPNVAILDARLREAHRFIGYLGAEDFIARLQVGIGLFHLYHVRAAQALSLLRSAAENRSLAAAPEARYWAGVAAYRAGGGLDALSAEWQQLAREFPTDDWTRRADCLDVDFAEAGFSMTQPDSAWLTANATNGVTSV